MLRSQIRFKKDRMDVENLLRTSSSAHIWSETETGEERGQRPPQKAKERMNGGASDAIIFD